MVLDKRVIQVPETRYDMLGLSDDEVWVLRGALEEYAERHEDSHYGRVASDLYETIDHGR